MTLSILSRPYRLRFVEAHGLVDDVTGVAEGRKAIITIDRDLDPAGMKQILLHEICHAISVDLNLRLTESQCAGLGTGLASIRQLQLVLPKR